MTPKLFILRVLALTLCGKAAVLGATITVTNTNDTGAGSLRAAITSAVTGDTIDFNLASLPGTISLTSAELLINKSLTVRGPGADQLTISGANARRVLRVRITTAGVAGATISGLKIADGTTTANGGGIHLEQGGLTLFNCVVANNTAPGASAVGGGIMADAGTRLGVFDSVVRDNSCAFSGGGIGTPTTIGAEVTVARSTISGNSATASGSRGGGVYVTPASSCTLANTRVTGNSAAGIGGGIYNLGSASIQGGSVDLNQVLAPFGEGGGISNEGTLTLTAATVSGNTAANSNGIGGGLHNSATLTVIRSTISGNTAAGQTGGAGGGGIMNTGTLTVTNSTISGNSVTAANIRGGGIYNSVSGVANLSSCTIAFNSCPTSGGGVAAAAGGTVTCRNNLIARNTGLNNPGGTVDAAGTFTTQGFNLIGSVNVGVVGFNTLSGDLLGGTGGAAINPLLDPLADNGGLTRTHALQAGSPAIDVGSPGFGIVTDQRGFSRYTDNPGVAGLAGGDASDIGAFESGSSTLRITSITQPPDGSIVLQGVGLPNALHTVEASQMPDGASFTAIAPILSDAAGVLRYQDNDAPSLLKRFYRFTFP
jgi:Right handed beta helix region